MLTHRLARKRRDHIDCGRRLQRRFRHWLGEARTLLSLSLTGYIWSRNVRVNRRLGQSAAPLRELAGAAWLVSSWQRYPLRFRRLTSRRSGTA